MLQRALLPGGCWGDPWSCSRGDSLPEAAALFSGCCGGDPWFPHVGAVGSQAARVGQAPAAVPRGLGPQQPGPARPGGGGRHGQPGQPGRAARGLGEPALAVSLTASVHFQTQESLNPNNLEYWMEDIYTPGYDSLLKRKEAEFRRAKVCKIAALVAAAACTVILVIVVPICTMKS